MPRPRTLGYRQSNGIRRGKGSDPDSVGDQKLVPRASLTARGQTDPPQEIRCHPFLQTLPQQRLQLIPWRHTPAPSTRLGTRLACFCCERADPVLTMDRPFHRHAGCGDRQVPAVENPAYTRYCRWICGASPRRLLDPAFDTGVPFAYRRRRITLWPLLPSGSTEICRSATRI